ncbi:hypothetical protein Pmani_035380 [Petrolisthes manimaculis]|uniref:Glycosyltransferase family 92 protein n=1 Tax=Petrolisthes manimaculis TaxID=1843537 RepID=A0AAE1TQI8_9EUCA|nr:hypothetical protein Pmani_035380 [Petrolisthes manimaculis]
MCFRTFKRLACCRRLRALEWRWNIKSEIRELRILLWCILGVVGVLMLYRTLFLHLPGIHVQCECGEKVATEERVSRYLPSLMAERDTNSNRTVLEEIEASHPSLAIRFLTEVEEEGGPGGSGGRCATTPSLFSIQHSNTVWQKARVAGGVIFLIYGAYWDVREDQGPYVRVLTMVDSPQPPTPHCLFYHHPQQPPTSTKAVRMDYVHWQEKLSGNWLPYLITCSASVGVGVSEGVGGVVGEGVGVPRAVSLVGSECETPTNALRVHYNPPTTTVIPAAASPRPHPRPQSHHWKRNPIVDLDTPKEDQSGKKTQGSNHNSLKENPGPLEPPPEPPNRNPRTPTQNPGKLVHNSKEPERNHKKEPVQNSQRGKKKDLVLCHKFLFNPARDDSYRLVEWVEAARAWGVDNISLYLASTHPNVTRVLQHYQKEGYVSVVPWSSPDPLPTLPHLYRALFDTQRYVLFTTENVPYTDCLLRHVSSHRYVAVWDLDEFILPGPQFQSLPEMIDAAKDRATSLGRRRPVSYLARCAYYFDDMADPPSAALPEYLHLLRHVTRSVKFTPTAVFTKAIHDTDVALGLHAHFALVTLEGNLDKDNDLYNLYPSTEGHLAHYRAKCQGEDQTECQHEFRPFLTRDLTMWSHRDRVAARVKKVLLQLSLIHPHPT